ncbi:hypothetical protein [Streptomyces sp. NPDC051546]|uniref:hypothetical protein n=1 Tax=Streptomyces sp. NPDC051546 TaxID=3365655 RepID=UPI0037916065
MASTKRSRKARGASPSTSRRAPGRLERGSAATIRASRKGGKADARWAAVEGLLTQLSRALDDAVADKDHYAVVQLSARVLDTLDAMRLTPDKAGGQANELGEFLASLAHPTIPGPALGHAS